MLLPWIGSTLLVACRPTTEPPLAPLDPAAPASHPAPAVAPPQDCGALPPPAVEGPPDGPRWWVAVAQGAPIHLGGQTLHPTASPDEPPIALRLQAEQDRCLHVVYEGPTWELHMWVHADDLAPVITRRVVARAKGDAVGREDDLGLWLAPGAPVVIDRRESPPGVRLLVPGIEASGVVEADAVGLRFQPAPLPDEALGRTVLEFDEAMPLFTDVEQGAFAVVDLRAGAWTLGDGPDTTSLPLTRTATFQTTRVAAEGDWVDVDVRDDEGRYRLRGRTPAKAVHPKRGYILGSLGPGPLELPAAVALRVDGVLVGRTTEPGRYREDESGALQLPSDFGTFSIGYDAP